MILTRTPTRLPIGGGGTDLPFYYQKHGGFLITASINQYVNILVNHRFEKEIRVSYWKTEMATSPETIQHPIVREALKLLELDSCIEIVSIADVPAKSGLGSSGSFTVGLLHALHTYRGDDISASSLAEEACKIEMDVLKEPTGKQDQYAAAFGGFICMDIDREGFVRVTRLKLPGDVIDDMNSKIVYFYTGVQRDAGTVIKDQKKRVESDSKVLDRLTQIKEIGFKIKSALEKEDLKTYGDLLHQHWLAKRQTSALMTDDGLDKIYNKAIDSGARGGKLIGAGGGGFFMFYCDDLDSRQRVRKALSGAGLREIKIVLEPNGSRVFLNA